MSLKNQGQAPRVEGEESCTSPQINIDKDVPPSSETDAVCGSNDGELPQSIIGAAKEFRMDCEVSTTKFPRQFFCVVCGSPAGKDPFYCMDEYHPICQLCQEELELRKCPFPVGRGDGGKGKKICKSELIRCSSSFRNFIFQNTKVSCRNKESGCGVEGVWEEVRVHQDNCEFDKYGE